jgi:hypothetical protein
LDSAVAENFPVAAAAEVERLQLSGPLFNNFDWGGYLEWRLPLLPAAIDGRTNLHGDDRIARFEQIWNATPGCVDDPDLSAAATVIAPATIPLVSVLKLDPRFDKVYEDKIAVVFARRQPQAAQPEKQR